MKKKIIYGLIFFCAIVLQTSVLPLISPANSVGDMLLMMILAGAILDGFFNFFWWSIFVGIAYDLVIFTVVGVHSLIFLSVVYFVSFFSRRFSVELKGVGLFLFMMFVIVATFFSRIAIALLAVWDMKSWNVFWSNLGDPGVIGIQILYDILLFSICFAVFKKAKKIFAID